MKAAKQQSVGVEISQDELKLVALGAGSKPVYAQSFPWDSTTASWATALADVFAKVFGKSQPQKVGVALSLRSAKSMYLKPSVQNPDLDAYAQWANALYAGSSADGFVLEYAPVEGSVLPTLNTLSLRTEELVEIRSVLQSTHLRPKILDSHLLALANAASSLGEDAGDALVIHLSQGRSQWLALRGGALQLWGDFSISLDSASDLFWSKRLGEKVQELSAKWPSRPVYLSGSLLAHPEVAPVLQVEFAEYQILDKLAGLLPALESAAYAAAWTMAQRAGEEK